MTAFARMSFDGAGRTGSAYVALKTFETLLRGISDYHRHRVVGIENVPREGPAVLVYNHSLATYDSFLPAIDIYDATNRVMHAVLHKHLLAAPFLGKALRDVGFTDGSKERVLDILRRDQDLVGIVPGGVRESLRPSTKKYVVDWTNRFGFVRVSMLSGAPIVLCACPRADDIFDVAESPITRWSYERLRFPMPVFRGIGLTPIPRPVRLTHVFSEPIFPPVQGDAITEDDVREHHAALTTRMNALMTEALDA